MDELMKYLKAMVYLQAQQVSTVESAVKAEVLLARAGFPYEEIADVLGKSEMAVAKSQKLRANGQNDFPLLIHSVKNLF